MFLSQRSGLTDRRLPIIREATPMKTIASVAAVVLLLGSGAAAQTFDDLKNDGKNTDNILTYGPTWVMSRVRTCRSNTAGLPTVMMHCRQPPTEAAGYSSPNL
jgi:hypothetical protein